MKNKYIFLKLFLITQLCHTQKVFSQSSTFNYTGAVQTYTVPTAVFSISITAKGAQGGQGEGVGGHGAILTAPFAVTPGQVLDIIVGQQPAAAIYCAGGGGGSFVWNASSSTLLMAAGGGGGGGYSGVPIGLDASLTTSGTNGGGGATYGGAGTGGNGGVAPSYVYYGAGGCGWLSNGAGGVGLCSNATGGTKPLSGGAGGTFGGTTLYDGNGGYGGGGGGQGQCNATGAGGGGGYSGGGGGAGSPFPSGGGGGSYSSAATTSSSATNTGNGQVIITVLCTTPIAGTITGPGAVCAGSSVTLSDPSGTPGGVWSSTNTSIATVNSTTGAVTGVTSGAVTISYSIVLSCGSAFAATSLFVNPLPLAISGPSNVCVGSSIGLSDGATGGTWSSSNTSVANAVATSGLVTGITQGTTTIIYTLPTGCSITTVVSSNLPPSAIAGPSSVCMGSTITLSNTATGGAWSSSNTSIATFGTTGGLLTPVSPGTISVTYANGCGAPATATVVVNPLPASVTGTTSMCITASDTLHDATGGGVWSSTNTAAVSVGSSSGIVTGVAAGFSTVSYTLSTGCAATALITVIPPLSPITGLPTVCVGQTTFLSGLPTGGTWLSGSPDLATIGSSSGIVTGVSMGTSVITYTAGVGCSATLQITVNPRAPILGRDSVCVGATTFLTNIVGGGIWSSSNGFVATTTLDSGKVTGVTPGGSTIIYLLPTGCQSSVTFSVIAYPDPITGTTNTCSGFATTLFDLVPAGGVWSSNNLSVATVGATTGIVTGATADTVSIGYTILPGCTVTKVVTVNPLPAPIAANTPVCPGITDSLREATPGGSWSTSTPSLATVIDTSGVVTTLAGGSAIISYTLPTGCYRTKTLSIDPVPGPIITYDPYTNTIYADSMPGFIGYQWYDSITGLIPGATSPSLAALYNEYYFVVVTDTNGCKGASSFFHYTPIVSGIKSTNVNSHITIYPNPVSGVLYVKSQMTLRAVITGIDGKTELEQQDAEKIDVSNLADGIYLIKLYDDSGQLQSVQKFTKQ